MHRYLSVAKMIEVEKASDQAGHTYDRMMAFAGRSVAEEVVLAYSHLVPPISVLGMVGPGNNGGDTLVAMGHLLSLGWKCTACLTSPRGDDELLGLFLSNGGEVFSIEDDENFSNLQMLVIEADILFDGILGTGIRLPLRPPVPEVLKVIRESLLNSDNPTRVVAVDCPSGIDCDTGEAAEECIPADLTVCLAAVKRGLLKLPGFSLLGELVVGDIGLDPALPVWAEINRYVIDQESVEAMLPERLLDGHKGTFGKAIIVGGSIQYPGAPILAGKSAFRSGAGWVTIVIPEILHPHLAGHFVEATWLPVPATDHGFSSKSLKGVIDQIKRADALLIGPGVGIDVETRVFINELVTEVIGDLVVDADGLKLLANVEEWWQVIPENSILTPHPGEMSILTGIEVENIQADRIGVAEKFACQWNQIVVLKGAFTVVAEPGGKTAILPVATPALARAGTGDVLAGIITGLRAQGMAGFEAACAGIWLHAQAGICAAELCGSTAGVLAGDLIEMLPELLPY